METSAFIDWISVTHKRGLDLLPDYVNRSHKEGRGKNGYTVGLHYSTGLVVMSNPSRPDMGTHIVYSGKTLQKICEQSGATRDDILKHHVDIGGKINRLDVSIDAVNSGIEIEDLWLDLENGKAKTKSQHSRSQSGNGKGYTLYVGSRKTRRKMLRIYDKALEQKWNFVDHKRIELETRRDVAINLSNMYLKSGCSIDVIKGSIKGVCTFPEHKLWNEIIDSDATKIPVGTFGDGDTEAWLIKQVAPSLARVIDANPEFMYKFWNAVQSSRENGIISEELDY